MVGIAAVRATTRDGTSFRRGGLRFGAEPVPIDRELPPESVAAILGDLRLRIEISEDGESFAEMPGELREQVITAAAFAVQEIPAGDGPQQTGEGLPGEAAAKDGEATGVPSADTIATAPSPAGGPGVSADGDVTSNEGMGGSTTPSVVAEDQTGGQDAAPAPVAGPKPVSLARPGRKRT